MLIDFSLPIGNISRLASRLTQISEVVPQTLGKSSDRFSPDIRYFLLPDPQYVACQDSAISCILCAFPNKQEIPPNMDQAQ
jgi:hypothetical protein